MSKNSQDEFGFGFGDSPENGDEFEESSEAIAPPEKPKRFARGGGGSSLSRILLLVLLGIALGGALFFYFSPGEEPAPAPQPAPVRRPVPAPPAAAPVPQQETAKPETASSVPHQAEPAAKPAPESAREVEKSAAPAPVKAETVAGPAAPASVPAKPTPAPAEVANPPASKPVPAVSDSGRFRVQVGAYGSEKHLNLAEQKIRKLGFTPLREKVEVNQPVTRLVVGRYPAADARTRLGPLKASAPDAYLLAVDGVNLDLCAGSYTQPGEAERETARLLKLGIEVKQVKATVPMSLQRLSVGLFASRNDAEAALQRVDKAGFDAQIVSLPGK